MLHEPCYLFTSPVHAPDKSLWPNPRIFNQYDATGKIMPVRSLYVCVKKRTRADCIWHYRLLRRHLSLYLSLTTGYPSAKFSGPRVLSLV